jgi:hypothetical protein
VLAAYSPPRCCGCPFPCWRAPRPIMQALAEAVVLLAGSRVRAVTPEAVARRAPAAAVPGWAATPAACTPVATVARGRRPLRVAWLRPEAGLARVARPLAQAGQAVARSRPVAGPARAGLLVAVTRARVACAPVQGAALIGQEAQAQGGPAVLVEEPRMREESAGQQARRTVCGLATSTKPQTRPV